MALARVESDAKGGLGLKYDVRVVAALALCVLALPPVVNAIMAQAAQQADTSWLRDADFDGDPEIDDPPPVQLNPGDRPPPDRTPPTPPPDRDRPPPPECTPDPQGQAIRLQDGISSPTGTLPPMVLRRDDVGVVVFINGTQVTGRPTFDLLRDGEVVWTSSAPSFSAAVRQQHEEQDARAPEEWTLRYDLSGVVYDTFRLEIMTSRCEVPSDGR